MSSIIRFFANIFVSIFVPKAKRAKVKSKIICFLPTLKVKRKCLKYGKNIGIGGKYEVTVNKKTELGDSVSIGGLVVFGSGSVKIGNYTHIGAGCMIISDNHNYMGNRIPYDETSIEKPVEIGDFCWLGVRTTILPGAKIGKGCVIQAGSVVHGEIPPYSIAGGNPAKVFKMRDIERFKELEAQGRFW